MPLLVNEGKDLLEMLKTGWDQNWAARMVQRSEESIVAGCEGGARRAPLRDYSGGLRAHPP
jgi:hypothetical protein